MHPPDCLKPYTGEYLKGAKKAIEYIFADDYPMLVEKNMAYACKLESGKLVYDKALDQSINAAFIGIMILNQEGELSAEDCLCAMNGLQAAVRVIQVAVGEAPLSTTLQEINFYLWNVGASFRLLFVTMNLYMRQNKYKLLNDLYIDQLPKLKKTCEWIVSLCHSNEDIFAKAFSNEKIVGKRTHEQKEQFNSFNVLRVHMNRLRIFFKEQLPTLRSNINVVNVKNQLDGIDKMFSDLSTAWGKWRVDAWDNRKRKDSTQATLESSLEKRARSSSKEDAEIAQAHESYKAGMDRASKALMKIIPFVYEYSTAGDRSIQASLGSACLNKNWHQQLMGRSLEECMAVFSVFKQLWTTLRAYCTSSIFTKAWDDPICQISACESILNELYVSGFLEYFGSICRSLMLNPDLVEYLDRCYQDVSAQEKYHAHLLSFAITLVKSLELVKNTIYSVLDRHNLRKIHRDEMHKISGHLHPMRFLEERRLDTGMDEAWVYYVDEACADIVPESQVMRLCNLQMMFSAAGLKPEALKKVFIKPGIDTTHYVMNMSSYWCYVQACLDTFRHQHYAGVSPSKSSMEVSGIMHTCYMHANSIYELVSKQRVPAQKKPIQQITIEGDEGETQLKVAESSFKKHSTVFSAGGRKVNIDPSTTVSKLSNKKVRFLGDFHEKKLGIFPPKTVLTWERLCGTNAKRFFRTKKPHM